MPSEPSEKFAAQMAQMAQMEISPGVIADPGSESRSMMPSEPSEKSAAQMAQMAKFENFLTSDPTSPASDLLHLSHLRRRWLR